MYYYRRPKNHLVIQDLDTALERIRQLEELMGVGFMVHPSLGLTRLEEAMLGAIYAANHTVTRDRVFDLLFGLHDDPPEPKIMDVAMSHLRRKLRPLGVHITTVWGRGWYLAPAERAKIEPYLFRPVAGEIEAA
jgi:two-component system cell cycle response regulator CtrA